MILVLGAALGLLAGLGRSLLGRYSYNPPDVRGFGLVLIAFVPQFLAFFAPGIRQTVTTPIAALALVSSQALLLVFVWLNRTIGAFWLLGLGLVMNLAVILANGGLMPISPQTINRLAPEIRIDTWQVGTRFGTNKDIILTPEQTRLEWLSDRFVVPSWFPQRVAYSLGDVVIAAGAFLLFWQAGHCQQNMPSQHYTTSA